ncbi:MAG: Imm63 family immunity protein [Sphingomonadaceae bacterium]|nr:DUF3592 domain-containing protein [Sphingomonadaceae bacterium]
MASFDTIARQHRANVLAMGGSEELAQINRAPQHDGNSHVEPARDGGWMLIVTDRGQKYERTHYASDGDLLYRLGSGAAFRLACDHELANRVEGQDSRRLLFTRQLDLVGRVSGEWRERLAAEIGAILASTPYSDEPVEVLNAKHPALGWLVVSAVVGGLLLVWALAHLPLWFAYDMERDLAARGLPLEAQVTDSSTSRPKIGTTYHLGYSYQVDGKLYDTRVVVSEAIGKGYSPGQTVPIRYDPALPERSLVVGNDRFERLLMIIGAIDALLAFLILGGLWRHIRGRTRQN